MMLIWGCNLLGGTSINEKCNYSPPCTMSLTSSRGLSKYLFSSSLGPELTCSASWREHTEARIQEYPYWPLAALQAGKSDSENIQRSTAISCTWWCDGNHNFLGRCNVVSIKLGKNMLSSLSTTQTGNYAPLSRVEPYLLHRIQHPTCQVHKHFWHWDQKLWIKVWEDLSWLGWSCRDTYRGRWNRHQYHSLCYTIYLDSWSLY